MGACWFYLLRQLEEYVSFYLSMNGSRVNSNYAGSAERDETRCYCGWPWQQPSGPLGTRPAQISALSFDEKRKKNLFLLYKMLCTDHRSSNAPKVTTITFWQCQHRA